MTIVPNIGEKRGIVMVEAFREEKKGEMYVYEAEIIPPPGNKVVRKVKIFRQKIKAPIPAPEG